MKTKEIKELLKKLKPAFKTNDISEFGKYVYFLDRKIMAYNGDICIIMNTDINGEVAIPIEEFDKFVNRVKTDEIVVNVSNNIEIKAGRATVTFAKNVEILEKIKQVNITIPTEFNELPTNFIEGLKLVRYSIAKDKSRDDQTYLKVENNKLVSTDNFRVSEFVLNSDMEKVFIPGAVLQYLISYNVKEYCVQNGIMYFKSQDNVYFMTRLGNVQFVEYEHLFDIDGEEFKFPVCMTEMVDTASITVEGISELDKMVEVNISNGFLSILSQNEVGKVETKEAIDNKTMQVSFYVNPDFMLDILKVTNKCVIADNTILFESENFKQLIALFNK